MENQEKLINTETDNFSVKEIISKIKELFYFIKLHFWKLFVIGIVGGGIGFLVAFTSKPIYPAKIKFLMKDASGSGALMSSLGNFGSLLGGATGIGSPMDRTLAVMASERIVGSTLLKQIEINGKADLVINHFINIEELHEEWKEDTVLNGVIFNKSASKLDLFNFSQRAAFRVILEILIGEKSKFIKKSFDKKSGVFEQIVNNSNEEFAIKFNNLLFVELEEFLYEQSVSSSSKNVDILSNKIDSIKNQLNFVQDKLARNTDRTLGLLMQEDKVDQKKLAMKEQMLTIMYGEAQKNYETFKFMNESINPRLDLLEIPFSPIEAKKKSKIKFTIIGFLFSGILGFAFLYTKKWLQTQL